MANHHFLCGQIRALESKLLTTDTADRMINASSLEDAFKGMLELQYADYIDEKTVPEDFSIIIDQGLFETKELISNGTGNDPIMNFLWGEFDLSNIKRALKQKLIEGRDSISDFTEDNGYSRLGSLNEEDLNNLVWEGKSAEDFALKNVCQAIEPALKTLKDSNWYAVETSLDQAFFDDLGVIASQSRSEFFNELYTKMIRSNQEQILGRVVIIEKRNVASDEWIHSEVGIPYSSIKDIDSADKIVDVIPELKIPKNASLQELAPILESWEKNQNHNLNDFVHNEAVGASDHLSVPFGYFKKRENNAHLLRFVLFSKSSGLSPQEIKKSLESTL